jgi:hypothetical protein
MRTIIAGGREWTDPGMVEAAVQASGWRKKITLVIAGGARGIDTFAVEWAYANGIPFEIYPADWAKFGKSAGMIRNRVMADAAGDGGALLAIPGKGAGTRGMIKIAFGRGMPVYVFE